jgi:hypothetical protein
MAQLCDATMLDALDELSWDLKTATFAAHFQGTLSRAETEILVAEVDGLSSCVKQLRDVVGT